MAIKREEAKIIFNLNNQWVVEKTTVNYVKFDDTNREFTKRIIETDPIILDETMSLRDIIALIKNTVE